ncbi:MULTISPECIES: DUF1433 domain-containing protein [Bacillus cereus group]|uniref:DUF1433 domain-containing protein n=1 Tax=Bacillus thuringiensis serovar sooncheon TaxID=180891 RepID=A0A9Q5SEV6_BACTU|nr:MULTISPECIES: DUF1433 domain-containing protein [Bacillus cereus group]OTW67677.1 DUF1433 domain-containing protein [Bacillus thuringiensis serovar coreanensis]OTX44294.1 DUF1433 domain-containing protein [Bacillus thuringiensis serovar sooncheon]OTX53457.1 DUF1433 domain-containing protein [Bacillus thuringiensis serovar guiyangiensis]OTX67778.1 DUF1433 domain-containing protein [Bacillus thuringiensis serovar roskildiensis]
MVIKFKKISFYFLLILVFATLEGCTVDNKKEEQLTVDKATETTIKYFKEKENLDIVITKHKFAPKDFQSVWISGHVKDDKNKTFSAAVEYANDYHIGSISTSEGFDLKN